MPVSFQIIILLAVALFLLVRLIGVLGRRDGFEPENQPMERPKPANDRQMIIDHQDDFDLESYGEDANIKKALVQAKQVEPGFRVDEFLHGAKSAYEMILMAFLDGDMTDVAPFVDKNVLEGFNQAIEARKEAGQSIEAQFVGIKNIELRDAKFSTRSKELVLSIDYTAELTRMVKDQEGKVLEGNKNKVETEFDHWQFARKMGSDDPNWLLVATGE